MCMTMWASPLLNVRAWSTWGASQPSDHLHNMWALCHLTASQRVGLDQASSGPEDLGQTCHKRERVSVIRVCVCVVYSRLPRLKDRTCSLSVQSVWHGISQMARSGGMFQCCGTPCPCLASARRQPQPPPQVWGGVVAQELCFEEPNPAGSRPRDLIGLCNTRT